MLPDSPFIIRKCGFSSVKSIDQIVSSIKEKREKLKWTMKVLSQKTNMPYGTLLRIENGVTIGMEDYISLIEVTLNKALNLPYKRWSYKYDQCIKCGTTLTKHIAHGYCKNCYDRNIEGKQKDVNRLRKYGGSSSLLTKAYLLDNYIINEKSLGDIAKGANCSRQYVHKMIVSHGIPLRTKSSARRFALDKGKVIRENVSFEGKQQFVTLNKVLLTDGFFSSWSHEMAYVLGVIYTDGCLNPRGGSCNMDRFQITQKDQEILIKVLALMKCNATIHYRKEMKYGDIKAGAVYWFSIADNKVYEALLSLGLTPHKSLTLNFPNMTKEHLRHFIRGCWDGDGSVYIDKQTQKIAASFVSRSLHFVEGMIEGLKNAGLPERKIYIHKGKSPSYYIRVTGAQVPKLYHYLYDDVPESQYLDRKYKLFRSSLREKTETLDILSQILVD